eukprot:TRINITY_DN5264_c0_g2_i3.p1 TRINITY_DN5264_c0_g2~~TRINITY_DN5264_c0_g2_i3.p1  ORF type:complete len:170 (-),score=3.25 TRINITY_DN5264_c0_g2_i3:160-669(-)
MRAGESYALVDFDAQEEEEEEEDEENEEPDSASRMSNRENEENEDVNMISHILDYEKNRDESATKSKGKTFGKLSLEVRCTGAVREVYLNQGKKVARIMNNDFLSSAAFPERNIFIVLDNLNNISICQGVYMNEVQNFRLINVQMVSNFPTILLNNICVNIHFYPQRGK